MVDKLEVDGEPPALTNVRCDDLICEQYWHQGKIDCPANVIYLRVGPIWHRLTFDCGIIFWRTQPDPPKAFAMPEFDSEAKLDDLGARLNLVGRMLESYAASVIPGGSQVLFKFEGGRQVVFKNINDTTSITL